MQHAASYVVLMKNTSWRFPNIKGILILSFWNKRMAYECHHGQIVNYAYGNTLVLLFSQFWPTWRNFIHFINIPSGFPRLGGWCTFLLWVWEEVWWCWSNKGICSQTDLDWNLSSVSYSYLGQVISPLWTSVYWSVNMLKQFSSFFLSSLLLLPCQLLA